MFKYMQNQVLLIPILMVTLCKTFQTASFPPAEESVFLQLDADFIGLLNHQRQLHGIPLWRSCNTEIKHQDMTPDF